ncbi:flagellar biosynthesis protein FlhF [Alkalibacillus sp. S2W]|uniref:flagellar biosynthesis protein FlhF n=1 Tax=Alkalibacillus sp. S2W TaxID=3386553 RepID=UPI00398CC349
MRVKKYTAPTMPEAMKDVRKELGDSAVILNSKEKKTKGFLGLFKKKNIEVVAAVDPSPMQQTKAKSVKEPNVNFQLDHQPSLNLKQPTQEPSSHDQDLIKEIKELRESLKDSKENTNYYPTPIDSVANDLRHLGIDQNTIQELMEPVMTEYYTNKKSQDISVYWQIVKDQIFHKMESATQYEQDARSKHIFLFGPTGVGKTTTLAKLAADFSINQGLDVGLITLDTFRIAAVDQLKTYAKILNLPVEVAYNHEDFLQAKEKFTDKDIVFIDTPGRNFREDRYIEEMKQFVEFEDHDELFCVLSLTSKEEDIDDIYAKFSSLSINQVILTKLDETSYLGSILNLWQQHQFRIAYLTTGQDVPDDIEPPSPQRMTDLIVGDQS